MQNIFSAHYLFKMNYLLVIIFSSSLCFATNVFAQNKHIYDHAKIYLPEQVSSYDTLLQNIESKSALRIEAVIVKQFSPYQPKEIIEHLQTVIANKEPALENNVLLVVSIQDDFAIVLPSESLESYYPEDIKKEIVARINKNIQSGDYTQILKSGVGGIVYYYEQATKNKDTPKSSVMSLIKENAFLLGIGLLVFAFFKFGRRKPRVIR